MKKYLPLILLVIASFLATAQPEDPKTLHETAKTFMRTGDFDNAIIVLTRALQQDKNNLEMQKDLVMTFFLKRDYQKAKEGAEELMSREDADVVTFQIAGNIYKALEEVKESGSLHSEYGELLFAIKDFSAIQLWEKGIEVDPGFGGNYYNAALYYFYAKDKVWSLIYGEIFVNMESLSERGAAMKQQLLQAYKEKLFADANLMTGEEKNKSEFAKAFLTSMEKQSSLANKGITVETLSMIRTRFILDWYATNAAKYPFKLFDYHKQLIAGGMFDAYNQWLFGSTENLAAYDNWTKTHSEEYAGFNAFQKNRVFRMPQGQYYQVL